MVAWRGQIVLLAMKILGYEGSRRESISARIDWLDVPSMRYLGSKETVQVTNLLIVAGTQESLESM